MTTTASRGPSLGGKGSSAAPVPIVYFSDVLCIWRYIAQLRVDAVEKAFGDKVRFDYRFCSVFGDTARKIPAAWGKVGGFDAFNAHLRQSAAQFPEVVLNPDIWLAVRPASSWSAHLFLKATQLEEATGACAPGTATQLLRSLRRTFFCDGRDIARRDVQRAAASDVGVDIRRVEMLISDGQAYAALASDHQDAEAMRIQGSPSFVFNDGRQKLYGNVGFRIISANIEELLRAPQADQASWC